MVATLLLGVILLDTVNGDPAAGKNTPVDEAAVAAIVDACPLPREDLYTQLNSAKFSCEFWDALTPAVCLRVDYKQFSVPRAADAGGGEVVVGMASLCAPLEMFMTKPGVAEALSACVTSRNLNAVIVLCVTTSPKFRRSALFCAPDVDALTGLVTAVAPALQLEALETLLPPFTPLTPDSPLYGFASGLPPKYSRKRVAPEVLDFCQSPTCSL